MIYFVRTAKVAPLSGKESWEFAKKSAKYVKEKYPNASMEMLTRMSGKQDEIVWVMKFESLTAYEEFYKQLGNDEGYNKLIEELMKAEEKKGRPFLAEGMIDTYYRTVDL